MSKCELRIELMEPDAPRRPGDKVQGFVTVSINAPVNCRGLHICLRNRTHGRGNTWTDDVVDDLAYVGEWSPGEELVYPFEFTLPNGPVTYHGKLLNVVWQIYTYVDIPWAFDPEAETEFLVVPGKLRPSLGPKAHRLGGGPAGLVTPPRTPKWLGALFIPVLFVIPMMVFVSGEGGPFTAFASVVCVLVTVLGGGLGFLALRNTLAQRKLGSVDLRWGASDLIAGDTVGVEVQFTPPTPVTLRGAVLRLIAEEVVVSGSGTNRTTHRETVHSFEEPLASAGEYSGSVTWTGRAPLPERAPPSFAADDNTLAWHAEVQIDIPTWPDFVHRQPIRVYPRGTP